MKGTIDRIEENKAVIKLENGEALIWPADQLPENAKPGTAINLALVTDDNTTSEQEAIAKNVLNEILKQD
jgi:hypothetical protein